MFFISLFVVVNQSLMADISVVDTAEQLKVQALKPDTWACILALPLTDQSCDLSELQLTHV